MQLRDLSLKIIAPLTFIAFLIGLSPVALKAQTPGMDEEIEILDDGLDEELSIENDADIEDTLPDESGAIDELPEDEDLVFETNEPEELIFDTDEIDSGSESPLEESLGSNLDSEIPSEDEFAGIEESESPLEDSSQTYDESLPSDESTEEECYAGEVLEGPPNGQGGWVIVEPTPPLIYSKSSSVSLLPYRERRSRWSIMSSLGYSWYLPSNYEPTVGAFAEFSDLYSENPKGPLLELQFTMKRNFSFASIGLDAGAGLFSVESKIDGVESTLDITMYRVGLTLILDTLFREPWVAPYVAGGGYVIQKKESIDSTSDNESTQVAPYYAFGLLFQLDWIDSNSSINAYSDFGLENTYMFAEGRQLISSSAEADSDFSTDIFATAGFRVEL